MTKGVMIDVLNLTFNTNAVFLHILNGSGITDDDIAKSLTEASLGKVRNYPIDVRRFSDSTIPGIKYSLRLFKSKNKPSFFLKHKDGWEEQKVGYILIIEYLDFIVILKRNASVVSTIMKKLEPLSYEQLQCMYVDAHTEFEKLHMYNLDGSSSAVRSKTIEAESLQESFSTIGASRFVLRNFRANNTGTKIAMALTSSRINEFSGSNSLLEICKWVKRTVDKYKKVHIQETFLSVFANSVDYEKQKDVLEPVSLLLFPNVVINGVENRRFLFEKVRKGSMHTISGHHIVKYLSYFKHYLEINKVYDAKGKLVYKVLNNGKDSGIEIRKLSKRISLHSDVWRKVYVTDTISSNKQTLSSLINNSFEYNVYFSNSQLIYTNNRLFEDKRLLGNIDLFLKVFTPLAGLDKTTSEKGGSTVADAFDSHCVFGVVEKYAISRHQYLICDDLGSEWADHIGIDDHTVSFYVSKHKDSKCSASDFQDVVGQALKNLGNLTPTDAQFNSRRTKWMSTWNGTALKRFRSNTGSVDDAINLWRGAINHPYFNREMNLVVNFISLRDITTYLTNIKNGVSFAKKNEAFQLLWLLSSLIANCRQLDVSVRILCKK